MRITVTEKDCNLKNLYYIQTTLAELFKGAKCSVNISTAGSRNLLSIDCPEEYYEIVKAETADKVAEVIAVGYKYVFFKDSVRLAGLSSAEYELLLAGLISADFDEDKKYIFDRVKGQGEIATDGVYYFRLKPLIAKWRDIAGYMPNCFLNTQLKDFILYLSENKKKKTFIDKGKVYDCHFRRLLRADLMDGDKLRLIKEIILSNCSEVEICGEIPDEDEYYIREFFGDRITMRKNYLS